MPQNPRNISDGDGRLYRAMNITVPIEIWHTINDQKHARRTTYAEVVENAIRHTYMHLNDDRKGTD